MSKIKDMWKAATSWVRVQKDSPPVVVDPPTFITPQPKAEPVKDVVKAASVPSVKPATAKKKKKGK